MIEWFKKKPARVFFVLELVYLVALLVLAVFYVQEDRFSTFIRDPIDILPVAWFGALGAVSISLKGVFDHNMNWDPKWNYWHIARPLTGAVLGSIGYLLFATAADAYAGGDSNGGAGTTGALISYLIGFVVGYREETFRELVKRFTDLILSPAGTDTQAPTPPGGVTATAESGKVTVIWNASSDNVGVTSYNVYRNTALVAEVGGGVTEYVDEDVQAGTEYSYAVTARDAAGNESATSAAATVTP